MTAFSDFLENELLDHVLKGATYTPPTDVYIALHKATTLNAQALAAQAVIVTVDQIANVAGLPVVVDPGGANEEAHTVVSVTGAGPYTVTLNSNLAVTQPLGTKVKFDIDDPVATLLEPSGGAYARLKIDDVTLKFKVAAAGATDNNEDWSFTAATADWGLITAVAVMDALTAGNALFHGNLTTAKLIQNGDTFKFAAGALDITLD
ncbi:MAG: hypothetical protein ACE5H8_02200 [Alphaproteobacteria bacterium]